jgi:hypothetical protein
MNEQSAGSETKTESVRQKITIGLLVAVVGGLILAWAQPRVGEQEIDQVVATKFLTDYYKDVVRPSSREESWSKLTSEFQTQPKVGGREGYWDFWDTIRQVNVADVDPQDRRNDFRARLIYKLVNGKSQLINTTYRLKCIPWYERLPSLTCKQEHIRIRATFGTTYP